MLFTRALLACGLLAMMTIPTEAANNEKKPSIIESTKQLSKERQKEEKSERAAEKSEKSEQSIEKADKEAEKDAEQAQARERGLPKHEDHHKLGGNNHVDKGFDFGTSNSK